MFTGSYEGNIDDKGRVVIPMKLRLCLGERIWAVKGVDGCLNLFTQDAWREYTETYINNRTLKDEKARQLRRFVFGGSHELEIDRQGRINLPHDLTVFAGIEKSVVFIGDGDLVELWGTESYEKEVNPDRLNLKELMSDAAEAAPLYDV